MYRQSVNSSNLSSVGYENSTLEVEFNNGTVYQYFNVPNFIYSALMSAYSHGEYFAQNIKSNYQCRKIN